MINAQDETLNQPDSVSPSDRMRATKAPKTKRSNKNKVR